jgi:predicted  nucleic acid-binding Zn-ribbon protein
VSPTAQNVPAATPSNADLIDASFSALLLRRDTLQAEIKKLSDDIAWLTELFGLVQQLKVAPTYQQAELVRKISEDESSVGLEAGEAKKSICLMRRVRDKLRSKMR